MKTPKILLSTVCAIALAGCAQSMEQAKTMSWAEMAGTLGGAVVGGYAGSYFGGGIGQTFFTAMGVMAGGGAGYTGARILSQRDQAMYSQTAQKALAANATGELHRWTNPESGRSGIFRTVGAYQRPDGSQCKQYRSSVVFDNGVASAGGAACQQPDGNWLAYNDSFR
jgi:surface antigen